MTPLEIDMKNIKIILQKEGWKMKNDTDVHVG